MIGGPELLPDEPTTGFDPAARRRFWELIRRLADEGTTIVLTTHYLDEAEGLSDRLAVIAAGKVVAGGAPAELRERHGGRATVHWSEPGGGARQEETETPTRTVAELMGRFDGEIPGLRIARPPLTVVGEADSGPRAEALSASLRPDVVLMDLRMPDGDGVESIARMTAAGLPSRVIVLTTYETDGDILRAVEAGAAGYLLKDMPRAELAEAVRSAARGETVLAPSVAARLMDQLRDRPERPRLSERETDVLRLVAEGCTNAEIGRRLFIGESTVKTHLLRAFGKLGVADRTAAVTSAMRLGLLQEAAKGGPGRSPGPF